MTQARVTEVDIAYIAGFFDGEGCVSSSLHHNKSTVTPVLTISQRDPEILEWIAERIACGRVYKKSRGDHALRISGVFNIVPVALMLLPYTKVKRPQLEEMINLCLGSMEERREAHQELRRLKRGKR